MNIAIIEGDNTIGDKIGAILKENGFNVSYISITDIENEQKLSSKLKNNDVIFNIAYNFILEKKIQTANEYIGIFRKLTSIIAKLDKKPKLFISTSFTSIYDSKDIHTEMSIKYSNNYLSHISMEIEDIISPMKDKGIRTGIFRLPLVVDNEIFLTKLTSIYRRKFYIKDIKHRNFLSWVSTDDIARACYFVINNNDINGVFNLVSPKMTHSQELIEYLKLKYGKSIVKMPNMLVKRYMKNYIHLFANLKVQPKRLLDSGFEFEDKILSKFLDKILK